MAGILQAAILVGAVARHPGRYLAHHRHSPLLPESVGEDTGIFFCLFPLRHVLSALIFIDIKYFFV